MVRVIVFNSAFGAFSRAHGSRGRSGDLGGYLLHDFRCFTISSASLFDACLVNMLTVY